MQSLPSLARILSPLNVEERIENGGIVLVKLTKGGLGWFGLGRKKPQQLAQISNIIIDAHGMVRALDLDPTTDEEKSVSEILKIMKENHIDAVLV
jgi:hypothetical protein